MTGHQRWVWDAAFSADSAYLVTGECCKETIAAKLTLQRPQITRRVCGIYRLARPSGSMTDTIGAFTSDSQADPKSAAVCCALNDINLA